MGKAAVNDLIDQYQKAFKMLVAEMERFDDHQWVTGIDNFQVPVKLTMHILDCLDYYFSGKIGHYIYALRHTMHHQGELAVLSIYHGNEGGSWE
jgi:hypothetical protein